ncbi:MAG: cupin domain-containing protein [Henriciella sp.]|jgi:quercetin dioxygenase-like cupin family protein
MYRLVLAAIALAATAQNGVAERSGGVVELINGYGLPGELKPLQNVTTMLDTIDADGNRLLVTRGVREAGTRIGIHVHKYGGHTCVLSGAITDFVEGRQPALFEAGSCYYMPPNVPMSAVNLGSEDAVLIDTFIVPPGEPFISILEPGYPGGPRE